MNINSKIGDDHPQFVSIPDSRTRGISAYTEGAEPHPLQLTFLDLAGEQAWIGEMGSLLAANRADEADARLTAALAGFDGSIATLCKATTPADIVLEGWEDLLPILAEWEGPPITAITLGLANPRDLVFGAPQNPEPDLMIRIYSDEAFPFSRARNADLLAESRSELPAWIDAEEDVEFYCKVSGIAELNAALINCKHRYFLRDGTQSRAPGGYVEYVLGCWLLATRFLQSVTQAASEHGVPDACRLIVGTVELNADYIAVIGADQPAAAAPTNAPPAETGFAVLTAKPYVPREDPTAEAPTATLRQRINAPEAAAGRQPKPGFLARLLGRFRRS
ncbi:MAG: hypothetical protein ABI240_07495 [Sphingomonas sp.]